MRSHAPQRRRTQCTTRVPPPPLGNQLSGHRVLGTRRLSSALETCAAPRARPLTRCCPSHRLCRGRPLPGQTVGRIQDIIADLVRFQEEAEKDLARQGIIVQ